LTLKYKALLEMKKDILFIRRVLVFFIIMLFLSGLTAIPLETELEILRRIFPDGGAGFWFDQVYEGLLNHSIYYPFMNYGYDWLAFAHFVLAILFVGPYRDPVRNIWVIEFGMIACVLIIPFAFVAGHFRAIPIAWRLIDCSFGVLGFVPLALVRKRIRLINNSNT